MKRLLIISAIFAGLIGLASQFFVIVNQTEYVVITQFGQPRAVIDKPGLRLKLPPPIQTVYRFDKRLRLFESRPVEYLTKDKKNIVVKCFICWQVDAPKKFFESTGPTGIVEQRLEDTLISKGGSAIGDFGFDDLISLERDIRLAELEARIEKGIGDQLAKHYGIKTVLAGISQIALPQQNALSVYNRMQAERRAIANKYRAEGREKAAIIRAEADRERSDILARAYEQSQITIGKSEAKAARIYNQAFSQNPEFYDFWRSMETYRKVLDKKTTLVLSQDSKLFKYFND